MEHHSCTKTKVKACAWFTVAASQGHQEAEEWRETVEYSMTNKDVAKAKKFSFKYWEKYVVPFQKD